ncbi:MAG TPA: magnesium transporter CorA family protein [Chloroflexota bacterium]
MAKRAPRIDDRPAHDADGDELEAAAADARESRALAGGGTGIPRSVQDVVDMEDAAHTVASSGETAQAIHLWVFGEGPDPRAGRIEELDQLVKDDKIFVWLDLSEYEPDVLHQIAGILDLNRVAVHVALSPWQRPRLDSFGDHYFVAATIARVDEEEYRIQAGQLDLFVGDNFLVSTHKLPLPFSRNIMERSHHNPELIDLDSSYMLYIILDELLAYYEDLAADTRAEIERTEEQALEDPTDTFLQDLLRLKRYVFALDQLVEQHRQVFEAFLRPDFNFVSGSELDVYFRDLDARLARLLDTLRITRDSVNGAFDIYVSHMAHRTNNIIKLLTIVSTVIFPLTLVVSFFGTSFKTVPLYGTGGFVAMIIMIVLVAGGALGLLRSQGWL